MSEKTLENLFHDTLRDIYYAERKILTALPKMARGAKDPKLKEAFKAHKEQTEGHVERLQRVFEIIGKNPRGKTCPAIDGIIEEGAEILEEYKGMPALDAGLLAAAQAVEHYEITRYLSTWAKQLGIDEAVDLLEQTLKEESETDEQRTQLAQTAVNAAAQKAA